MRAFIAIELPDEVRREIGRVQEQLRRSGAQAGWTRPDGIHLTLKFLGEVREEQAAGILDAMRSAGRGFPGFRIGIAGAGAFPGAGSPRVLWLGIAEGAERVAALQEAVEAAMTALGFPPEDRKFVPHLTLARVRYLRPGDDWQKRIEGIRDIRLPVFTAGTVSLMRSELRPGGAVYTEVGRAELGGQKTGRSEA